MNTKSLSMFKLKKFRKFPYYSINDFDDQSFVQYGKSFSNFFENLNYFNDKLWHKKWYTNGFSKLTKMLAHEIKNPLSAIKGSAQLLSYEMQEEKKRVY